MSKDYVDDQVMKLIRRRKYDIIALLTNIAKSAVKEKVLRVVVATFRVS